MLQEQTPATATGRGPLARGHSPRAAGRGPLTKGHSAGAIVGVCSNNRKAVTLDIEAYFLQHITTYAYRSIISATGISHLDTQKHLLAFFPWSHSYCSLPVMTTRRKVSGSKIFHTHGNLQPSTLCLLSYFASCCPSVIIRTPSGQNTCC